MTQIRPLIAAFAAALLLTACGFQLRGVTQLPAELSPVHVQAPQGSRIGYHLTRSLGNSGIQLTADRGDAGLSTAGTLSPSKPWIQIWCISRGISSSAAPSPP